MASSISGEKAHRKIMLPIMCDQLACMNIAVRIVIQWWPETICAGITDHAVTKASPLSSSRTKTKTFTTMMRIVMIGTCVGRRDASFNGIKPPIRYSSVPGTATGFSRRCLQHRAKAALTEYVEPKKLRRRGGCLAHRQRQHDARESADNHAYADQRADG